MSWYAANRSRFACKLVFQDSKQDFDFAFSGVHWALRGGFSSTGISVLVEYQQQQWDMPFDSDVYLERKGDGYVCRLREMDAPAPPTDRITLWTQHLFEPLLAWVNEQLAPSHWLVLEGDDFYACAALTRERPALNTKLKRGVTRLIIPIRQES